MQPQFTEQDVAAACASQGAGMLEKMLDDGLPLDFEFQGMQGLLHKAAALNNAAACRMLVERGCDVNQIVQYGKRPVEVAVANDAVQAYRQLKHLGAGHGEEGELTARLLEECGAQVDAPALDIVVDLVRDGANPFESANGRNSPMDNILSQKGEKLVMALLALAKDFDEAREKTDPNDEDFMSFLQFNLPQSRFEAAVRSCNTKVMAEVLDNALAGHYADIQPASVLEAVKAGCEAAWSQALLPRDDGHQPKVERDVSQALVYMRSWLARQVASQCAAELCEELVASQGTRPTP